MPQALDGILWSTPEVFVRTLEVPKKADRLVYALPRWSDIDTFDDLKVLVAENPNTSFAEPATMKHVRNKE